MFLGGRGESVRASKLRVNVFILLRAQRVWHGGALVGRVGRKGWRWRDGEGEGGGG